MKVRIYTDGACSGNPGPGGWAAIMLFDNSRQEISGYEPDTTNNRMELTAAVEALKLAITLKCDNIEIYSDSAYVVNAIKKEWLKKWKLNGWKTAEDKDVKNRDLWERLDKFMQRVHKTNFVKIKGHTGHKHNERVDLLAKKEIERMR